MNTTTDTLPLREIGGKNVILQGNDVDGAPTVTVASAVDRNGGAPFRQLVAGDDDGIILTILQFLDNQTLLYSCALACRRFEEHAWRSITPMVRSKSLGHCHSVVAASQCGCVRAVERMLALRRGEPLFDPSVDGSFALRLASLNGHAAVVRQLLDDRRADPCAADSDALRVSCERCHVEVVRMLLADGRADPMAHDGNAIRVACGLGHHHIARELLADARVDPSVNRNEALNRAITSNHVGIIDLLLADSRVDPSAHHNEALRLACASVTTTAVRLLLAHSRVDPSERHGSSSALLAACRRGNADILQVLLEDGRIDPTASDNEALRLARSLFRGKVVRLLQADSRVAAAIARS